MNCRKLTASDFAIGLRIHPELFGRAAVPDQTARKLWNALVMAPGFQGVAVVSDQSGSSDSVCAFGASVFVEDSFASQELANPSPGLNGRVALHSLKPGSIVFNRSKIASANGGQGLTVAVLAGRWNPALVSASDIEEARLHLATTFAELHAGYRFKRVMIELISQNDRRFYEEVPFLRIHSEFGQSRALGIVEKADVQKNHGSVLGPHFSCPLPRLSLREPEQSLLRAAMDGATDEDLQQRLNLSQSAIKRRWAMIFQRIAAELPELLPPTVNSVRTVRGTQKRHLVLAYIRKHPQELRPFLRPSGVKG